MKKTISLLWFSLVLNSIYCQWSSGTNIYNTNTGNVGVGTTNPASRFHVNGASTLEGATTIFGINATNNSDQNYLQFTDASGGGNILARLQSKRGTNGNMGILKFLVGNDQTSALTINEDASSTFSSNLTVFGLNATNNSDQNYLQFTDASGGGNILAKLQSRRGSNGNMGMLKFLMGNSQTLALTINEDATSKFHNNIFVDGNISGNGYITTKKITISQVGWSDYVFDDDYKLRSLSSLETFIKKNKHLPDIPSAKEVEEEGISVGDNQALLLKKIEELTLYIIQLKNESKKQQKEINALKKQVR